MGLCRGGGTGDLGVAEPGWRGIGAGTVAVPRTWTSASAPALITWRSGRAGSWVSTAGHGATQGWTWLLPHQASALGRPMCCGCPVCKDEKKFMTRPCHRPQPAGTWPFMWSLGCPCSPGRSGAPALLLQVAQAEVLSGSVRPSVGLFRSRIPAQRAC